MPRRSKRQQLCCYCNTTVLDPVRVRETGYQHCTSSDCVIAYRRERLEGFRVVLVPKQGFTIVEYDGNALTHGKSSGR